MGTTPPPRNPLAATEYEGTCERKSTCSSALVGERAGDADPPSYGRMIGGRKVVVTTGEVEMGEEVVEGPVGE